MDFVQQNNGRISIRSFVVCSWYTIRLWSAVCCDTFIKNADNEKRVFYSCADSFFFTFALLFFQKHNTSTEKVATQLHMHSPDRYSTDTVYTTHTTHTRLGRDFCVISHKWREAMKNFRISYCMWAYFISLWALRNDFGFRWISMDENGQLEHWFR